MDDEQTIVELLQLLVAGNETSSNTLSWTFYLLAKHPEHIVAMRKEIETAFGTDEISYEKMHELSYVIGVLNEAMRLYPPFWMIDRVALSDDQVCDIKVTAGTTVVPYIYGVHQNENIWKNPDRFDPARFLGKDKRHPFSHIPFGGGPRVCIGQNMAMMQMLFVIVAIVRRYDFALEPSRNIHKRAMMILRPDGPINMSFSRATKAS
jgi:cytochrome P450